MSEIDRVIYKFFEDLHKNEIDESLIGPDIDWDYMYDMFKESEIDELIFEVIKLKYIKWLKAQSAITSIN